MDARLKGVVAFLQPIVSVRQRGVRMVEALARGIEPNGRIRTPSELFAEAQRDKFHPELEQHCRRAALTAYGSLTDSERPPALSLNTDTTLVQLGSHGADRLMREVSEAGLSPTSVALEILESAISDLAQLEAFCKAARRHGFLVALDDVGTGHSNLERIPRLEPDILKIDRVLVHGMSDNYHRREVFRSLLVLSHQIGAIAIAEGVEEENDVMVALGLGCDMFQGFYFGRPLAPEDGALVFDAARLRAAGDRFRASATRRLNERRMRRRRSEVAIRALLVKMKEVGEPAFGAMLRRELENVPFVEALYILDERGVQITDTVHAGQSSRQALFHPSVRGADQSLKQYFLMLQAGLDRYTSDPYISSASGNFCITMSRMFSNMLGQNYVLCCDLVVPRDES